MISREIGTRHTSIGCVGIGTILHIARRAADDRHQLDSPKQLIDKARLNPIPVIDRAYFHPDIFRKQGGILFEIAIDPPGFPIDEKPKDWIAAKVSRMALAIRAKVELVLRR
jgi:hypothetical protein